MATGPGLAVVESMVRALPGLGLVRDAQKWVALGGAGLHARGRGGGADASALAAGRRHRGGLQARPDRDAARSGVGGRRQGRRGAVPAGWAAAAATINADPRPVAVLPAGSMRHFPWAGDAPVLDPLPRWVRADVLTTGDLTISGRLVPGEGDRARDVQRLLAAGADHDALARAGVGWLVVESGGRCHRHPDRRRPPRCVSPRVVDRRASAWLRSFLPVWPARSPGRATLAGSEWVTALTLG